MPWPGRLEFDDLFTIAREQIRREDADLLGPQTHRFLICDTTPLTTLFYPHELFGRAVPEPDELARRAYAQVALCADDFPFA